ncbi:MAG: lysozyme inhibitor LprI family protein [Alphaproteobacteria bacterium]|nr:lysozyme inhibitor LprI family protein [Alphaproteobacteria bacterium]
MKRFGWAAVLLVGYAPGAYAQSFDCEAAVRADERAVCDSRELARLDDKLSDAYEEVLADVEGGQKRQLRADQRDWLAMRRACGARKVCIRGVYRERIAELKALERRLDDDDDDDVIVDDDRYRDRDRDRDRDRGRGRDRDSVDVPGRGRWTALGSVEVERFYERRVIRVGFEKGRFRALRLRARDGGVKIRRLTIVYGNGERERLRLRRRFRAGEETRDLELVGRAGGRFIRRIVIRARRVGLRNSTARIDVIGKRAGRGGFGRGRYADRDRDEGYEERRPDRDGYRSRSRRFEDDDREGRLERDERGTRGSERTERDFDEGDEDRDIERRSDRFGSLDDRDDGPVGRSRNSDRRRALDEALRVPDERDLALRRDDDDADDVVRDGDRRPVLSLKTRLREFIVNDFHRTAEMSMAELRRTYAKRVDYYGVKRKPVEEVIADKKNYGARWADRAFRIKPGTLRIEETNKDDVYDVTYRYDFHVKNDTRESKGEGETKLRVDTSAERVVILRENGKVLKRY